VKSLKIEVHTNSKKPRIIEKFDVLHIYVSEQAIDGKANKAVLKTLAEYFDVGVSQIEIFRGLKAKIKIVRFG